jgi:zinc D-Ala-D-Ala carboxypeptidase
MNLTPHFTLDEMLKSQTALRRGLDNSPEPKQLENLLTLCEKVLEPIRVHWAKPVVINSGFRSLLVNRAVGSKDSSQHARGEAADIEIPGIDNLALYYWIAEEIDFDQLILEFYTGEPSSGWVHVSYVGDENRHQTLRIDKSGVTRETLPRKEKS